MLISSSRSRAIVLKPFSSGLNRHSNFKKVQLACQQIKQFQLQLMWSSLYDSTRDSNKSHPSFDFSFLCFLTTCCEKTAILENIWFNVVWKSDVFYCLNLYFVLHKHCALTVVIMNYYVTCPLWENCDCDYITGTAVTSHDLLSNLANIVRAPWLSPSCSQVWLSDVIRSINRNVTNVSVTDCLCFNRQIKALMLPTSCLKRALVKNH